MSRFSQTRDYTYAKFIDNYKKITIPSFQRAYTWSNQNITELWNSILANEAPYFIGNIVCIEASKDYEDRLQIVDGQQRLTTINLILIALRDKYRSINPNSDHDREVISSAITRINQYIVGVDYGVVPNIKYIRLKLNNDSYQETLTELIDGDNKNDTNKKRRNEVQKKILRNYHTFLKLIDEFISDRLIDQTELKTLDIIREIEEKVLNLQVIVIEVKTDNDVYSIFEGINSTGVGLSVSDLIKNSILKYTTGIDKGEIASKNWDQLEEIFLNFNKVNLFPRFLRHQWIAENGYINTSDLFREIRDTKLANKNVEEIIRYTSRLIADANIYMSIKEWKNTDQLKLSKTINDNLERFHWLNNQQMYEILLAYINRHLLKDGFKDSQLNKALDKLWIFSFRSLFVSISGSAYEKKFADHCKLIRVCNSSQIVENIDKFYNSLNNLVSSTEQFVENFSSDMKYQSDTGQLLRYIFKKIMEIDDHNFEITSPNIEHILPQSPVKWGLQPRDVSQYVHRVGNLVILNSKDNLIDSSNESFSSKVEKVYSKSNFKFIQDICNYKEFEFDPELAINTRSIDIAKKVEETFRL